MSSLDHEVSAENKKCLPSVSPKYHCYHQSKQTRSSNAPRVPLPQNVLVKQKQAFHGERLTDLKRL